VNHVGAEDRRRRREQGAGRAPPGQAAVCRGEREGARREEKGWEGEREEKGRGGEKLTFGDLTPAITIYKT
jgi:hypothetical protein